MIAWLWSACSMFEPPSAQTVPTAPPAAAEARPATPDTPPPVAVGAAAAAGTVDIFMAAGVPSGTSSCHFSGLSQSAAACQIHRLRWDLAKNQPVDHAVEVSDQGFMPSVSPDGTRLAYAHLITAAGGRPMAQLAVTKIDGTPEATTRQTPSLPGMFSFPHWLDDQHLLASRPDQGVQCKSPRDGSCQKVERWGSIYTVDVAGTSLGKAAPAFDADFFGSMSLEDTWVNPKDRSLVAGHGRYIKTGERPACGTGPSPDCRSLVQTPYPFVFDVDQKRWWGFQLETTESKFRSPDGRGLPLAGCAHLSWSPDGGTLMCTEQSTDAIKQAGLSGRLFAFSFDAAVDRPGVLNPKTVEPLFNHKAYQDLIPISPGETCDVYYHKYAEFCGDAKHVVASIVCDCSSPQCKTAAPTKIVQAHVWLIDITDPASPRYTDLTAALEATSGQRGLRSFTATCGPKR
jgi:hypothetical protein